MRYGLLTVVEFRLSNLWSLVRSRCTLLMRPNKVKTAVVRKYSPDFLVMVIQFYKMLETCSGWQVSRIKVKSCFRKAHFKLKGSILPACRSLLPSSTPSIQEALWVCFWRHPQNVSLVTFHECILVSQWISQLTLICCLFYLHSKPERSFHRTLYFAKPMIVRL